MKQGLSSCSYTSITPEGGTKVSFQATTLLAGQDYRQLFFLTDKMNKAILDGWPLSIIRSTPSNAANKIPRSDWKT